MKHKLRLGALLAATLAAITIGTSASVVAADVADGKVGVAAEKVKYLPGRQTRETIAARQHFFGIDNVNPRTGQVRADRVIMSWMGVSTFAASFMGHVVMLDGFLAFGRSGTWGSSKEYLHTSIEEYAAINPEAYFFDHGHSDHMGHAPEIFAILPSLRAFGVAEHCNDLKGAMAPAVVDCTAIMPAGAPFGTEGVYPANLIPGVEIRAVKHPLSAGPLDPVNDPAFPTEQAVQRPCISYSLYPPDGTEPTPFGGPTSGVLSLSVQFKIVGTNFALGWAGTTGDISGNRPVAGLGTGAEVPPVYARWPHTNWLFGSIAVSPRRIFNQQITAIEPQVFTAIHHDPCTFDVKRAMDDQMKTLPDALKPQLRWIDDPGAYGMPIVIDPSSPAWN